MKMDLEEMLRLKQDALRGRPMTRWELFAEWYEMRRPDWLAIADTIIIGASVVSIVSLAIILAKLA